MSVTAPTGALLAVGHSVQCGQTHNELESGLGGKTSIRAILFRTEGEVPLTLRASHRPARPTPAPIFSVECRSRGALCQERGKNNLVFPQNSTQW